jgi:hypothetical protein
MVHCVMKYSLYQGILCFQSDIWFHGTHVNVPMFVPTGKVWPSLNLYLHYSQMLSQHYVQICYAEFYPNRTSVDRMDRNSIKPQLKCGF